MEVRIPSHGLAASQRRMLLEMLASERAGESALHVGHHFGRDATADDLRAQGLAVGYGPHSVVFTALGRCVAEGLASQIIGRVRAAGLAS